MQNPTSQVLFNYWNDVRGARLAPRRFEIEPARISRILPETFVAEQSEQGCFRFRLAGTRICEQLGLELRGLLIDTLVSAADRETLTTILHSVSAQGAAGVLLLETTSVDGRTARFEVLMLPLVHTDEKITRLLGAISPVQSPNWLGSTPMLPGRIVQSETIWPDGRPHAIIERSDRQAPFASYPSGARIVRNERRHFRVFDGGRKPGEPPTR